MKMFLMKEEDDRSCNSSGDGEKQRYSGDRSHNLAIG